MASLERPTARPTLNRKTAHKRCGFGSEVFSLLFFLSRLENAIGPNQRKARKVQFNNLRRVTVLKPNPVRFTMGGNGELFPISFDCYHLKFISTFTRIHLTGHAHLDRIGTLSD